MSATPGSRAQLRPVHLHDAGKKTYRAQRETLDEIGPWPREIHYMSDKGTSFDEHFDGAFQEIFDQGYEAIVSIGADIPTLPRARRRRSSGSRLLQRGSGHAGLRAGSVPGVRHVARRLQLRHAHQP